jgi:glycosyltransferase involved in cell wall biosynthesis
MYHVSPMFCEMTCKRTGPYCGKQISDEEELKFLHTGWWRLPPINNAEFAKTVRDRYTKEYDIHLPPEYPAIKEALKELWAFPGFKGIFLTGSLVAKNAPRPLKDYDVILWFEDVASALAAKKVYTPPKFVDGVRLDCFYNIGPGPAPDAYFAALDAEKKVLYLSRWMKLNVREVFDGITVVRREYAGLDKVLEQVPAWLEGANRVVGRPCSKVEKPKLSVVITVLNDQEELLETIKSIRETSPKREVEIVVIDDASAKPAEVPGDVLLKRNPARVGCGASRHLGAELAMADHLLFIDAHMRFVPGWYGKALLKIKARPTTLHCATCLGLGYGTMDLGQHKGAYHGARLVFDDAEGHVFEGVWAGSKSEDDYEIQCVMGACYFIPKDFFFKIGGLKSNWLWGADEPVLSLKAWLAGGDVRLLKDVQIGHKFRSEAPYTTDSGAVVYNKLRGMAVTLPEKEFERLDAVLVKDTAYPGAKQKFEADLEEILLERAEFRKVASRDVEWFKKKFSNPVNNPKFTAILYTDNRVADSVFQSCFVRLNESVVAAGGELITVAWNKLDAPRAENIGWDRHKADHENIYLQILAGIERARTDFVFLCEHDVFYAPEYFQAGLGVGTRGYNTNILHLSPAGYFSPSDGQVFLSNLAGTKAEIVAGVRAKLEEVRKSPVVWAEPRWGEVFEKWSSPVPVIDIRHGRNWTGDRQPVGDVKRAIEGYPETEGLARRVFV